MHKHPRRIEERDKEKHRRRIPPLDKTKPINVVLPPKNLKPIQQPPNRAAYSPIKKHQPQQQYRTNILFIWLGKENAE